MAFIGFCTVDSSASAHYALPDYAGMLVGVKIWIGEEESIARQQESELRAVHTELFDTLSSGKHHGETEKEWPSLTTDESYTISIPLPASTVDSSERDAYKDIEAAAGQDPFGTGKQVRREAEEDTVQSVEEQEEGVHEEFAVDSSSLYASSSSSSSS
eukprot:CAMPEP_0177678726 /NCGR_PEP_ID=MMETSP0447-20121125/29170_1 /TAXON_ID=0 /ORGANISM="Stygamoeba regulata, Strain BSH-02190019" /LENGTH=157 /DNA_ID=CAMNT_0019187763 /DNA_START=95 /DNA_END=565 /DNA_ORIENTATION=+